MERERWGDREEMKKERKWESRKGKYGQRKEDSSWYGWDFSFQTGWFEQGHMKAGEGGWSEEWPGGGEWLVGGGKGKLFVSFPSKRAIYRANGIPSSVICPCPPSPPSQPSRHPRASCFDRKQSPMSGWPSRWPPVPSHTCARTR